VVVVPSPVTVVMMVVVRRVDMGLRRRDPALDDPL